MSPGVRDLDEPERRAWLTLIRSRGVGPIGFFSLLERSGTVFDALESLPILAEPRRITPPGSDTIARELEDGAAAGARLIAFPEPDYPDLLRRIPDPPPILWLLGEPGAAHKACIALVGARNASAAGRAFAHRTARDLGLAGVTTVSGLARGVDGAAHRGALETGRTVAVVAGGVDVVYPDDHDALHRQIADGGAVLSERPMGARPTAQDFPRRNRIISGLSRAVGVIEAAERSGSLITARTANEQGRDVYAAPGSPMDPRAAGCLRLLKEGAGVLTGAEDLIASLQTQIPPPNVRETRAVSEPALQDEIPAETAVRSRSVGTTKPDDPRERIAELLSDTPVSSDTLCRLSGLSSAIVAAAILDLTLAGEAETDAAGRVFSRPINYG